MILSIGIDPGLSGGISFIRTVQSEIMSYTVYDMPTCEEGVDPVELNRIIIDEFSKYHYHLGFGKGDIHCFMEKTGAMSKGGVKQGTVSAHTFGEGTGIVKGVLGCRGVRPILIAPQKWQGSYWKTPKSVVGADARRKYAKEKSFEVASAMFKECSFCGPRGGKRDGRSDSILIANYGLSLIHDIEK